MNAAVTQAKALYMAEKQTAKDSFKIRINIKKGNYTLNSPITISDAENIEINGNGSQIVNKRFSGIINLNRCKNVSISNMSFDYDPLPYTQGVIQEIKDGGRTIVMKPDAGYPTQVAKLGNAGIMNVFDRSTKAPKAGSRQFIRVDAAADGAGGVITLSRFVSVPSRSRTMISYGPAIFFSVCIYNSSMRRMRSILLCKIRLSDRLSHF